jgi:hypothetical protein
MHSTLAQKAVPSVGSDAHSGGMRQPLLTFDRGTQGKASVTCYAPRLTPPRILRRAYSSVTPLPQLLIT